MCVGFSNETKHFFFHSKELIYSTNTYNYRPSRKIRNCSSKCLRRSIRRSILQIHSRMEISRCCSQRRSRSTVCQCRRCSVPKTCRRRISRRKQISRCRSKKRSCSTVCRCSSRRWTNVHSSSGASAGGRFRSISAAGGRFRSISAAGGRFRSKGKGFELDGPAAPDGAIMLDQSQSPQLSTRTRRTPQKRKKNEKKNHNLFSFSHSYFCRFPGNREIRENSYPYLTISSELSAHSTMELSDYSPTRCFNGSIWKTTSFTTFSAISSKTKLCTVRFATPTTSAFTIFTIFRTFRI